MSKLTIFAHRGASGHESENTPSAFQKALNLKTDGVELDVHRCKSGEIVVIHDKKINRTTDGKGKVKRMTLADIRRHKTQNDERIPTLKEVLDILDAQVLLNIELKGRNTARETANILRQAVRKGPWKYKDFIISSFSYREIKHFHDVCPEVKIGLLFPAKPAKLKKRAIRNNAYSVHLNSRYIKKIWIHEAHEYKLKVYVWTVDNPLVAKQYRSLGVDGIFSNFPDRFAKI